MRTALNTGVLVTGEHAVAIGGNASDVIISTGNQNIVLSFKGADAATVLTALSSGICRWLATGCKHVRFTLH